MRQAAMRQREDRQAYVLLRAYHLAAEGDHDSHLSIVRELVSEGYPEAAAWLNHQSVRETLDEFCVSQGASGH
jgi:hypothetical protein